MTRPIRFPNESPEYRRARTELLEAELELRAHTERVAELRRRLPAGGEVAENYVFDELVDGAVRTTRLSDLFAPGKDTLFVYSFMYSPDVDPACPMCTALLDGLDGQVEHLEQRINTAVVAKYGIEKIRAYADERGWTRLRLLSSAKNRYNVDYFGELDGKQTTTANVFVRDGETIRHFWNSELSYAPMIEGGNMRHLDSIWPLWGVLDTTPGGRGTDWYPEREYDV